MPKLDRKVVDGLVASIVMEPFYLKRLQKLTNLKLKTDILRRKNPYLFKAKNIGIAKKRDEEFQDAYNKKVNQMTSEFSREFLILSGQIDWEKLIDFLSKK